MKGLTSAHAQELFRHHGPNEIQSQQKTGLLSAFLNQFRNILTILLIIAALLSLGIGERVDSALIIAIVILNALFGVYQEKKAEDAISALRGMTAARSRVIRDGREIEIDSREIVPGDVVFIEEGTKIPADGVLAESHQVEINESALTGESLPVVKKSKEELFMGTLVAKGRGYLEVRATGMQTKFGSIAAHISAIEDTKTPLQRKLDEVSKLIGIIGIVASVIVFGLSVMQGHSTFTSFLLGISLAVAVVPEGLPAVMTITLSIGVKEMARRRAIMRKLSAVEALGSITLLATDKTGTLTTNSMRVKELYIDGKAHAEIHPGKLKSNSLDLLLLNGILCSTASLVPVYNEHAGDILGDPTEGALLYLARDAGLEAEAVRGEWQVLSEHPFDSVKKLMSVTVSKNSVQYTFTKGAPESVLEIVDRIDESGHVKKFTDEHKRSITSVMDSWARKGLRVLAFSYKTGDGGKEIMLGLVAIHDAPRPEVRDAVEKAAQAGIRVVMITGDNEKTAEAIAVHCGIMKPGEEVLTGHLLDEYDDAELLKILPRVRVFARTTPFHKSRIVSLYQKLGEIVAVTGDGVNDAIALKQADVGVAMGKNGTDVARETAHMIITDDNFATIVSAIEEGRNIMKNLKNAIQYLLACNISEALSLIVALALGIPDLFVAIQLLYINLVTDGIPALALAFSPRQDHIMKRKPEKKLTVIGREELEYIILVGLCATAIVIGSYYLYIPLGEAAGKTAAFCVLALIQSFILIDLWLTHKSILGNLHAFRSRVFLIAFLIPFAGQFVIVSIPAIAGAFGITVAPSVIFAEFIGLSAIVLVAIRGIKTVIRMN